MCLCHGVKRWLSSRSKCRSCHHILFPILTNWMTYLFHKYLSYTQSLWDLVWNSRYICRYLFITTRDSSDSDDFYCSIATVLWKLSNQPSYVEHFPLQHRRNNLQPSTPQYFVSSSFDMIMWHNRILLVMKKKYHTKYWYRYYVVQ